MLYRTGFNAYAVAFSPFLENRLAVATAQNFGIIGNGKQLVLEMTPQGLVEVAAFDTVDGLYDCAWSEGNEHVLISASGDGSIKIWDLQRPPQSNPLRSLHEHTHEVQSVQCNPVKHDLMLSAAWDDCVKLWSLDRPQSLQTFRAHTYCVYAAVWNPQAPDIFLSASGDCTVRVWDARHAAPTLSMRCHDNEVLSADWCKYNDCVLATASVDKSIRTWDVRAPREPLRTLTGHSYAVRRLLWSPHAENVLYSCSYDMTVRMWDVSAPAEPQLAVMDHHSEFAIGLDLSVLVEGMVASAGWDETVFVWRQGQDPRM